MNSADQIVALSIDKVQTFLTEAIHSHVQEKQKEKATLKNIMNASREISIDFQNTVKEAFSEGKTVELLSCSGVYIFECGMPEEQINAILNKLFLQYYRESQGQKWLLCVTFPKESDDPIEAIQKAKKLLKRSDCLNAKIEENKDVLFSFCAVNELNAPPNKDYESYPLFAKDIDALLSKKEADKEPRFRIAVIKADLDGMGEMFKAIHDPGDYGEISKILNEEISLEGLHKIMKDYGPRGRIGWLFPFYIAGDDIFFAVSVENLIEGIHVCQRILSAINEKLKKVKSSKPLSISIGVEITFNREPIRYYMEMVERQLKFAKEGKIPDLLKPFAMAKISICGLTFFSINYGELKENKKNLQCLKNKRKKRCNCSNCMKKRRIEEAQQAVPIWNFFLNDVYRLNTIRSNKKYCSLLGAPGFFYTLLERLSDETVQENNMKYINSVLYHLLPEFINSSDQKLQKLELILNGKILSQLMKRTWGEGMRIELNDSTKHRLETYLRLMLLFSDSRFELTSDVKTNLRCGDTELDDARKYLFSKSTDYLYKQVLETENKQLRDIFVKEESYRMGDGKRSGKCFQRLRIEKSMFVRMRDTGRVPAEKAAKMIELQNPETFEEIQKLNKERKDEGKSPCRLYFDKEKFLKLAQNKGAWNSDFVDSLMILYECRERSIKFKGTNKEQRR